MNFLKQIAGMLLVMVFLVTNTGVLIYQIHCSRTGEKEVSLFFSPETCDDEIPIHHTHKEKGEETEPGKHDCYECFSNQDACCSLPEVKYIRLLDQFTEEETTFLKTKGTDLVPIMLSLAEIDLKKDESESEFYIDPPPRFTTSIEFLIHIRKLKLPEIA